ncbi:hypothetical protein EI94DRAFT_1709463 [Lactarius quietus]|nr:hypothetical protein EI94DRAFT_1709463 [Lactarius quietus]
MQDVDNGSLTVQEPDTIPLHLLSIVDITGSDVTEHDMLANALANVSHVDKSDGWAVRRSSDFDLLKTPTTSLAVSLACFLMERVVSGPLPFYFERASTEEKAWKPLSNLFVRSLQHSLSAVRANMMGTNGSWLKICSHIWGMCVMKNLPSLWVTINPANMQDPIVEVFCGEEIDLNQFCSIDQHPSKAAIAANHYTASRFFHFMIKAILECLLGINGFKHNQHVPQKPGIFSLVEGYIGTMEAQGRGTLHLHLIIWLSGSVPADKMKDLFLHDEFRMRVKKFITVNIHADLTNVHGNSTLSLQLQHHVAFSRPVDPNSPDFEKEKDNAEKKSHALCRFINVVILA